MDEFDPDEVDLERRHPECVAGEASSYLSPEVKDDVVAWVLRAGLGNVYLNLRGGDPDVGPDLTANETGALMAMPFKFDRDPVHYAVYDLLREWAFEDTGASGEQVPTFPDAGRYVFTADTEEFVGDVENVQIHADVTPDGGVSVREIETETTEGDE